MRGMIEMDKKYEKMIIELILFYWIDLRPTKKLDKYIEEYMKEMNLTPESIVKKRHNIK